MSTTIYDTNNDGIVDNAEKVNGHTVKSDVPENAVFTDTKYSNATGTTSGLMSSEDKIKLNGIAENANNYSLPTASTTLGGVKTTSTVTSNSGYTACPIISGIPYYKDTNTIYSNATTSAAGLMSSGDKSRLDGIATGANKTTINNTLTSTSTSEALSANQGKVLNDKYNGTALYNNATGTTGTVTLSASAADFTYLDIFYRNDNNRYKSTKVYAPNGKTVSLLSSSLDSNSASNLKYKDITVSGTTISNVYTQTLQFWSGAWHNTDGNNKIFIVRVVGYK